MGVYDIVLHDGEEYQLKTWKRFMDVFKIGDEVPDLEEMYSGPVVSGPYSIMLAEDRKWLNVDAKNIITSITLTPEHDIRYDKWGGPILPGEDPYAGMR